MVNIKICAQCGEEKALSEFYTQNKTRKNGEKYIYYNLKCKECCISNSQSWIDDNYEKQLEYSSKYKSKPEVREKIYISNKKRLEENKFREWQQNNPEKIKKYTLTRSQHKKHTISKAEWIACKEYFGNSCAYCGLHESTHYKKYLDEYRKQDLHKEHVDHNGSNDLSNCIPACQSCNSEKHTSQLKEWYTEENEKFSNGRLNKILKWLNEDYKQYIKNR